MPTSNTFRSLIVTACDGFFKTLGVDTMDCACTGRLVDGFRLVTGDLECQGASTTCVTEAFCGAAALEARVAGGFGRNITGDVTGCLAGSIPHDLGDLDICVTGLSTGAGTPGLGFDDCSATMNGQTCECTPCGGKGFAFTFDCSGINISPLPGFPLAGPKVDTCQFLDFAPRGNRGD